MLKGWLEEEEEEEEEGDVGPGRNRELKEERRGTWDSVDEEREL